MPTHFFPLTILRQELEDEANISEALNFHAVTRFHTNSESADFAARVNAEQSLKDAYANLIHTKIAAGNAELREVEVEVAPARRSEKWRTPVTIRFHVVRSEREDGYLLAYVPVLSLEVLSKKAKEFDAKIEKEILSALKREGWVKSLEYLRRLERVQNVAITTEELALTIPTAKQRAIAEEKDDDEKSVIEEVCTNLADLGFPNIYEADKQTRLLAEVLRGKQPQSILLVGPSGVGKTSAFHELFRRRSELGLGDFEFWSTSGARLIAGQTGFGMWQERVSALIKDARSRNAIIHLGNLVELIEVGKSNNSTQGIASFLRPKIARSEFLTVVECTPEQLPLIERRDANLLGAFQQVRVEEPDRATSLKILESVAAETRTIPVDVVKTIDALHRRFSTYSAFPGRPVRFLRHLVAETDAATEIDEASVFNAFSNETGLPEMLLSDRITFEIDAAEEFFKRRVIGQTEAVSLIVKMIATVKAKLTRPRKPISSLLFIGPTGVGKTELTKALAEYFFSDESRLIRFDMSEFSNQIAVQRLIGGTGEAEGQLTAKVREQPFSVVLLDEFEKAHHSFFDLLLQMLGEGRLTDSRGRVADFTNSVIVMTSNLGASEFQRGKSGFTRGGREREAAIKHFDSAVKAFLRPEIYNRIDRIVPFAPLDRETVGRIASLEVEKLKRRDGLKFRPVAVELDAAAMNHLVENGYEIRYGARPLKRAIERELLAPLAAELNLHEADTKLDVTASIVENRIALDFAVAGETKRRTLAETRLVVLATNAARLRRRVQTLTASHKLNELRDEIVRVASLEALVVRGKWVSDEDRERITRKPWIVDFLARCEEFAESTNRFEDSILLEIYGRGEIAKAESSEDLNARELRLSKLLFELLGFQSRRPNEVKLSIFSESTSSIFMLLRIYRDYLEQNGGKFRRVVFFRAEKSVDGPEVLFDRKVRRREVDLKKDDPLAVSHEDVCGALIEIESELALATFGAESGLHSFSDPRRVGRVLVSTTDASFDKFKIPDELAKRDSIRHQPSRRTTDFVDGKMFDDQLDREYTIDAENFETTVSKAIADNLKRIAESLVR